MIALQNVQHIFIKASDFTDFSRATWVNKKKNHPIFQNSNITVKISLIFDRLLEASIDAAILTLTHAPPLASGVEQCSCPPEYDGTSCQDPSRGYYRWFESNFTSSYNVTTTIDTSFVELVGRARRCECNGRSDICDRETGHCLVSFIYLVVCRKKFENQLKVQFFKFCFVSRYGVKRNPQINNLFILLWKKKFFPWKIRTIVNSFEL